MTEVMKAARKLEDQPVRMRWNDGYEVVATLLSASVDLDGSAHLIYDRVVWNSGDLLNPGVCWYSEGDTLVSIELECPHHA